MTDDNSGVPDHRIGAERVVHEAGGQVYHSGLDCERLEYQRDNVDRLRMDADADGLEPCPGCVDGLSDRWRRRTLMATVGAGVVALVGALPGAHREAMLDADVELVGTTVDADTALVVGMQLRVANHESEPVDPVVIPWGRSQQSQLPWPRDVEGGEIPAGETRLVDARLTGKQARMVGLGTGYRNTVRIFDRGTEARAIEHFVARNPHGADTADGGGQQ
jgi:hypothetical protein